MYPPSSLDTMPFPTHNVIELQERFAERRLELQLTTSAAALAGRILSVFRSSVPVHVATPQPSMAWVGGPRSQPRDGRGRFLPRAWLADAELFLPADQAWFRSPLASTTER